MGQNVVQKLSVFTKATQLLVFENAMFDLLIKITPLPKHRALYKDPLYPVAKLNHVKIFGLFMRHELLPKHFYIHAKSRHFLFRMCRWEGLRPHIFDFSVAYHVC